MYNINLNIKSYFHLIHLFYYSSIPPSATSISSSSLMEAPSPKNSVGMSARPAGTTSMAPAASLSQTRSEDEGIEVNERCTTQFCRAAFEYWRLFVLCNPFV